MKVKLNTSRIKPIDGEEKEVLEIWNGEIIDIPEEVLKNTPEYNWEENVWIFEPVFAPSELVSVSAFGKNPSKYISMLQSWKLKKLGILKNNQITAVVYPFN